MEAHLTMVFEYQRNILWLREIGRTLGHTRYIASGGNPYMARISWREHGTKLFGNTRKLQNIKRMKPCGNLEEYLERINRVHGNDLPRRTRRVACPITGQAFRNCDPCLWLVFSPSFHHAGFFGGRRCLLLVFWTGKVGLKGPKFRASIFNKAWPTMATLLCRLFPVANVYVCIAYNRVSQRCQEKDG